MAMMCMEDYVSFIRPAYATHKVCDCTMQQTFYMYNDGYQHPQSEWMVDEMR